MDAKQPQLGRCLTPTHTHERFCSIRVHISDNTWQHIESCQQQQPLSSSRQQQEYLQVPLNSNSNPML
jgi:hypothetical protein